MDLDQIIFNTLHNFAGITPLIDNLIYFCGEYLIWIIGVIFFISALFHFKKHHGQSKYLPAIALLTALLSNVIVSYSLKILIHRVRPFQILSIPHLITDNSFAFPSGHTTFMFALATAVYSYNKKLSATLFGAGLLIGLSRIMGGVHWPSDILGGAIIGILSALLINKILRDISRIFTDKLPEKTT